MIFHHRDTEDTEQEELFEKFGQLFIDYLRDSNIEFYDRVLDDPQLFNRLRGQEKTLEGLSDEQRAFCHYLVANIVDDVLHDLLFMLESEEWITLSLTDGNVKIDDISGDMLQGYIFIWAEKYSKKRQAPDY